MASSSAHMWRASWPHATWPRTVTDERSGARQIMLTRSAAVRHFDRSDATRLFGVGLLMVVVLGGVLALDALPGPFAGPGLITGDVAATDILAPRALTYESSEQTRIAREDAREQVPPQYNY